MKYYIMIFRDIDYPDGGIEKIFNTTNDIEWCIGKKGSNIDINTNDICYIRKNKNGKNIVCYKAKVTKTSYIEKNIIYLKKEPFNQLSISKKDDNELYSSLNVKMFTGFGEIDQKVANKLNLMSDNLK